MLSIYYKSNNDYIQIYIEDTQIHKYINGLKYILDKKENFDSFIAKNHDELKYYNLFNLIKKIDNYSNTNYIWISENSKIILFVLISE